MQLESDSAWLWSRNSASWHHFAIIGLEIRLYGEVCHSAAVPSTRISGECRMLWQDVANKCKQQARQKDTKGHKRAEVQLLSSWQTIWQVLAVSHSPPPWTPARWHHWDHCAAWQPSCKLGPLLKASRNIGKKQCDPGAVPRYLGSVG